MYTNIYIYISYDLMEIHYCVRFRDPESAFQVNVLLQIRVFLSVWPHALPWHWTEMCVFYPSHAKKGQLWSIYDQSARQLSQPFHSHSSWWILGLSSPFWGLWRAVHANQWCTTSLCHSATLQRLKLPLRWLWISSTRSTRMATNTPWTKSRTSRSLIR